MRNGAGWMFHVKALVMGVVLSGLAACGGVGGGVGGDARSFGDLAEEGEFLLATYGELDRTPVADLPSGSVRYDGVAAFSSFYSDRANIVADPDSLAAVRFDADFDANTISGRAYDFRATTGVPISGSLSFDGAAIRDGSFISPISGTLTEGGARVSYGGTVQGDVVGTGGQAVVGSAAATATADGVSYPVYGVFAAD